MLFYLDCARAQANDFEWNWNKLFSSDMAMIRVHMGPLEIADNNFNVKIIFDH